MSVPDLIEVGLVTSLARMRQEKSHDDPHTSWQLVAVGNERLMWLLLGGPCSGARPYTCVHMDSTN